jgi:hypothetical protein
MQNLPDKGVSGSSFYLWAECTVTALTPSLHESQGLRTRKRGRHFPFWEADFPLSSLVLVRRPADVCAVCGGDGGLAALRRLPRSRQDRAVEGEILGSHSLGQNAGIMFDQVKPEIVLPQVDVLIADQAGSSGHSRGLPKDEFRLPGKPGRCKVSAPVHTGRLDAEVGAFPRVVLLEDVSGIGAWGVGLRYPNFKRPYPPRPGLRVCKICKFRMAAMCP